MSQPAPIQLATVAANSPRRRGPSLSLNKVIVTLLGNPTLTAAAQALGVDRTTLWRFMRRPGFRLQYECASHNVFYNATSQLQQVAANCVDTLSEVATDPGAPVFARIAAARNALNLAFKAAAVQNAAIQRRIESACLRKTAAEMNDKASDSGHPGL